MGLMKRAKLSVTVGTMAVAMAAVAMATMGVMGCVGGGSKGLSAEEKDKLKPYILDVAPTNIPHPIDVNFENKIHLIGYKFDPETAKPGADVKLTYWWRCDEPLDSGWALFTHLKDEASDKSDNLDWNGPLREEKNKGQVLGPDHWEKGKIYIDEQTYKMPDWIKGPDLTVLLGIWKQDARLRIVSGPNDGDNRAPIGKIKTGLTAAPPAAEQHTSTEVPRLNANKLAAGEKIVIDGKGDDKAWGVATSTGPFVDVLTGKPNATFPVNATAKITWDDTNLYVLYEVTEPEVVGYFTSKEKQPKDWTVSGQPKLWTKDTVELMIDPDGDNRDYYEIQINPQNKQFHSRYDSYNLPKTEPDGPFGHEDWSAKITSAVVVKGTLDKPGEKDQGYTVEAAIPWASFDKATNHPPKPFESWRVNLYAMKNNSGVAWSPIMGQGNFHKAARFGNITWGVAGMTPPAPSASAAVPLDGGPPPMAGRRADGGPVMFRPHGMRPPMFPRVPAAPPPH
jgi:hypothetical protein